MDDAGVLRFETIVWSTGKYPTFQTASCSVDTSAGEFVVETSNLRGVVNGKYHDGDNPYMKIDPAEIRQERLRCEAEVAGLTKKIAELEAAGDIERATEGRELLAGLTSTHERLFGLWSEMDKLIAEGELVADKLGHVQVNIAQDAFQIGLQEMQWINKPDHYTVEVGSAGPPRKAGKHQADRVRRLADRNRYIVLTKSEIADAWHRSHRGGTHASPLPHLRRGHYRTLERATPGERRVWVRATHVNGQCVEWRDGDVRYKVI